VLRRVSAWRADHPRPPPPSAPSPTSPPPPGLLGVNLGKNKAQADAAADYAAGARAFAPLADFLVVNVSSPNTPGLRALQSRASLTALLKAAVAARDAACAEAAGGEEKGARAWWWGGRAAAAPPPSARVPPLLVKVDADADDAAAADVAAAALAAGVDGVIVSNTTVTRPPSIASLPSAREAGGLSGPPLRPLATAAVARMHRLLKGRLPIVGVGGVGDGEAAYEKIKAGASLVELYTALAYDGPALVPRVKAELAALLAADGYESVADAVGVEAHKY
jgi:dihydroorotate dehydrogenase